MDLGAIWHFVNNVQSCPILQFLLCTTEAVLAVLALANVNSHEIYKAHCTLLSSATLCMAPLAFFYSCTFHLCDTLIPCYSAPQES